MSFVNSLLIFLFLLKIRLRKSNNGIPIPTKSKAEMLPVLISSKYCIDSPAAKKIYIADSALSMKNAIKGKTNAEPRI